MDEFIGEISNFGFDGIFCCFQRTIKDTGASPSGRVYRFAVLLDDHQLVEIETDASNKSKSAAAYDFWVDTIDGDIEIQKCIGFVA